MLKGFGGASTAHGINGSMSSLCLVGGNDCTPGSTPDLTVKGGAKIKKNLCVLGRTKLETLEVKSDASIGGNLTVGGDEMISGDILVVGKAAICGNVYLKEEIRVLGDATFDSNVHIKGNELIDGDVAVVGDAAICGNVYMKDELNVMGNLNACKNLNVDCINEKTLNHGVKIEGVVIKDGMISVPTPGIAACIQDSDLSSTVCVDTLGDPDTVTMTVDSVKKVHLSRIGGWSQGNIAGTNVVLASGEDAFASGQGTQNIVTILGKTDIDGRTGVINLVASGKGSHAEGGATVASGDYSHAEGIGTQAVGRGSHAEGIGSKATGMGAHAEGDPTLASGDYSHAEGVNTTASGFASHSAGENATAGPANNTYAWSDGTIFTNNTSGRYAIRAGGQVLIDNGATNKAVTSTYNNQTTWSYTPIAPSNWPVGLNNVAQALDSLSSGASVLMGPTDVTGTANNNKVVSFQTGISLNGTVASRNIGVGVGTITSVTSGSDNIGVGNNALRNNTTGVKNIAIGTNALLQNTTTFSSIAIGNNTLSQSTVGQQIGIGESALQSNTSGSNNLAVGTFALTANTTGGQNTAIGNSALGQNTTASNNTAVGVSALNQNLTGASNTGVGSQTLTSNQTGSDNSGVGKQALLFNTASFNTAMGSEAMRQNTTGTNNAAFGYQALTTATTADNTTAMGSSALRSITTGINNTAVGSSSMFNATTSNQNVAVGHDSLRALISGGGNSVAVGYQALWASTVGLQTAVGSGALQNTTTGAQNTAVGYHSMQNNTTGSLNNAFGYESLFNNTTGSPNLAFGTEALRTNMLGSTNIGIGNRALRNNVANKNIGVGHSAMESLAGSFSGNPNKPYVYVPGATATINTTTSVITSSVAIFTSDMVGARLFLADSSNSLVTLTIRQFISSTQVLTTNVTSGGLISLVWNNFYITIEQSSTVIQGATQTGTTLTLNSFSVFWPPFSINILGITGDPYELIGCMVVFPDGSESTITSFVSKSNSSFITTFTATPSRTISTVNYVLITKPAILNTTIGNNTMQLQKYGFDNVMYGDDVHKESTDYASPITGYTIFTPPFQTVLLGKGAASGKNPITTTAAIRRCVMLGHQAGEQAGAIFDSTFIGKDAARKIAGSTSDVILGAFSGSSVKSLASTSLIGNRVLATSQGFHDNIVALGTSAMQNYGSGSFFNEGYLASQTGIVVTIENGPVTPNMAKGSLIIFDNRVQAETTNSMFGNTAYVSVNQTVALQKFICVGGSERYTTGTVTYYDTLEVDYRLFSNVLQLSGGGEFTPDMVGGLIVTSSSFIFRVNEVISPSVVQVNAFQSNISNNLIPINTTISAAFNGSGTLNVYGDLSSWPNTGSFTFSAFTLGLNLGPDVLRPIVLEYTPFPASTLQVSQTTNWPTNGSFSINSDNYTYSGRTSISTTVTAGGNLTLSPSTISVTSTAGFAASGVMALVSTTNNQQYPVRYTGITATQFTGCVYAVGNLSVTLPYTTSWYVSYGTLTGIQTAFDLNYPPSIIPPGFTVAQLSVNLIKYNYTGKTSNTLTGCTCPTGCTITWPIDTQVTFSYSPTVTNQSYYLYYGNGTSNNNAVVGPSACQSARGGIRNSVLGARTLTNTISGSNNVTLGYKSMESLTHSSYNNNDAEGVEDASSYNCVTVGSETGKNLESNPGIVAVGYKALTSNNSATNCVAVGYNALLSNGETTVTLGVKFIGNKMSRNQGTPSLSDSNTNPPFFNKDMVGGTVIRNTSITGYFYQETIVGYLDENTLLLSDNVINYNPFIQVRILYGKMYNVGTVSQTGNLVTPAGGATFTKNMIGGNIVYFVAQANLATINRNPVYTAVINDIDINGNLIVYPSQNIVAGTSYKIYYGGSNNTATGHKALESSKLERNTAFGSEAGQSIIKGTRNTIVGYKTNFQNEIGYDNTVVGDNAMVQTNICYSAGTASQSGTTITGGDGAYYTPSMVGGTIVYNNYAKAIPQITTLPSATINVDSTAQFPSSGTILVETNLSTIYSTNPVVIIPLPIAGATLNVSNTTGFPTSGTLIIICGKTLTIPPNLLGSQPVVQFPYAFTYTGKTATTFTGVSGGASTFSIFGGATIYYKQPQVITYSGKTATSFTGCTGTNLAGQIGSTTPLYAYNKPQMTISGFVNNTTLTAMSALSTGDVVSQPYAIYFGTQYTIGTITQSSFTVTGSGTSWQSTFVGGVIIYSTGDTAQIQSVNTSLQTMLVDKEYTFASPTTYIIHYGASSNVVIGSGSGQTLRIGGNNTLIGTQSDTSATTSKAVCVGDSSNVLGNGNVVLGQGSTDNAQSNVIVLGSGVTASSVTSGNQLVLGSGITPAVGTVTITNYIQINVGGTVYKLPIGV